MTQDASFRTRVILVQNGRDLEIHDFHMPDDVDDEWGLIWFHILDNGHIGEDHAVKVYKNFFEKDEDRIIDIHPAEVSDLEIKK